MVERFRGEGYEPEGYALYSYAAVQVWAEAAARAKSTAAPAVAAALHAGPFEAVVGPMRFDAKGDVLEPKYAVHAWKDGRYEVDTPAAR